MPRCLAPVLNRVTVAGTSARTLLIGDNFDATVMRRYATHVGVLLLIMVAFFFGRLPLPAASAVSTFGWENATVEEVQPGLDVTLPLPQPLSFLSLTKAAVPRTTIPERPREGLFIYKVQPGDTLYGIAQKFGISGETVMWANDQEDNPDVLRIGQEMVILPVSGVYHTVKQGDTVESVAAKYQVKPSAITDFEENHLKPPYALKADDKIVVPGGQKPYVARVVHAYAGPVPTGAVHGTGIFGWPTSGLITQKYWGGHRALDIAAAEGTSIYAADSGYVALEGWSNVGYGNMILIDHGNGFQTLYAHLKGFVVRQGDSVKKGQKIATMGSTGRATGTHLHFEIRKAGVQRNPIGILP